MLQHNFRSGSATFEQIIGWAYPWRHVLAFLVPNIFGNPSQHGYFDLFTWQWTAATVNAQGQPIDNIFWGVKNYVEGGAYVGLLPLFLVLVAFVAWVRQLRHKQTDDTRPRMPLGFFFVLGFFALSFAFPTRLYALIFWLPGINQLHSPFRWVWPLSLCVAVLSAVGFEALAAQNGSGATRRWPLAAVWRVVCLWSEPSLVTALAGLAVWGGALVALGLLVARLGYDAFGVGRLMDRLLQRLSLADQAFANGRMFFSYEAPWILAFALLLIATGIVLRASRSRRAWRGRPAWQLLALGVLVVDLSAAGWGFNPSADPKILGYTPPSVDFLRQDTSLWRFTTFDTAGAKPFNANLGWYFDFYDIRGYDSIFQPAVQTLHGADPATDRAGLQPHRAHFRRGRLELAAARFAQRQVPDQPGTDRQSEVSARVLGRSQDLRKHHRAAARLPAAANGDPGHPRFWPGRAKL